MLNAQMPRLAQLEKENEQQKGEFFHLAERIQRMTLKLGELQELDDKLKVMANFKSDGDEDNTKIQGVGGSEPTLLMLDHSNRKMELDKNIINVSTKKDDRSVSPVGKAISSTHGDNVSGSPIFVDNEIIFSQYKSESHPYSLMLGFYRNVERAKKAVSINRMKGLSPYYVRVDLKKKGIWFRVFINHFKNREEAEKYRRDYGLSRSIVMKTRYANLIGIYSAEDKLQERILSLNKIGYFPYIIKDDQKQFQLFVGAFLTKAGAEQQYNDLHSSGFQNQIVKR
jgi:cell division septation protein DedD